MRISMVKCAILVRKNKLRRNRQLLLNYILIQSHRHYIKLNHEYSILIVLNGRYHVQLLFVLMS